jgi:hypothetical protein
MVRFPSRFSSLLILKLSRTFAKTIGFGVLSHEQRAWKTSVDDATIASLQQLSPARTALIDKLRSLSRPTVIKTVFLKASRTRE